MLNRHKILFLIPAIILIPIILGLTPLNMGHKLASGCPFTHGKQVKLNNHCPFHSAVSRDDPAIVDLNLSPLDLESTPTFDIQVLDLDSVHSNITFNSGPLRC